MRVVWSRLAIERAYELAAYIAGDKPEAARRWLDGLFNVTDRLEIFPESGRIVQEIGLSAFREVIYGKAYRSSISSRRSACRSLLFEALRNP